MLTGKSLVASIRKCNRLGALLRVMTSSSLQAFVSNASMTAISARNLMRTFSTSHRHKKVLKWAKGYRGRSNRCYRLAKLRVHDNAKFYN